MGMRLRSGCVRADPRRRDALPECVRVCELGDVCLVSVPGSCVCVLSRHEQGETRNRTKRTEDV